jgi:hypothetical protein
MRQIRDSIDRDSRCSWRQQVFMRGECVRGCSRGMRPWTFPRKASLLAPPSPSVYVPNQRASERQRERRGAKMAQHQCDNRLGVQLMLYGLISLRLPCTFSCHA